MRQASRDLAAQRTQLLSLKEQIESQQRAGPELARELSKLRAEQEKSRAELAARVKARQPALEALAGITAGLFDRPDERVIVRDQLLDLFKRSEVAQIKDDGVFVVRARGLAESYYLSRIKYPYLDLEKQAFDSWVRTIPQGRKNARERSLGYHGQLIATGDW